MCQGIALLLVQQQKLPQITKKALAGAEYIWSDKQLTSCINAWKIENDFRAKTIDS